LKVHNRLLKVCYVPTTSASLSRLLFLFFLQWPLTVLMKQTRQAVHAFKQPSLLICLWLSITFCCRVHYCYAISHFAECRCSEYYYDQRRHAVCRNAAFHCTECQHADCHYAERHYTECQYDDCHYAECHSLYCF
jgi:hypothetical protein